MVKVAGEADVQTVELRKKALRNATAIVAIADGRPASVADQLEERYAIGEISDAEVFDALNNRYRAH